MDKYNKMDAEAEAKREEARRQCWERYNQKRLAQMGGGGAALDSDLPAANEKQQQEQKEFEDDEKDQHQSNDVDDNEKDLVKAINGGKIKCLFRLPPLEGQTGGNLPYGGRIFLYSDHFVFRPVVVTQNTRENYMHLFRVEFNHIIGSSI